MILNRLAELLKVRSDEVEAVLREDEQRAKETVSRRRFMGAAAALASAPFVPSAWGLPLSTGDNAFMWGRDVAWDDVVLGFALEDGGSGDPVWVSIPGPEIMKTPDSWRTVTEVSIGGRVKVYEGRLWATPDAWGAAR